MHSAATSRRFTWVILYKMLKLDKNMLTLIAYSANKTSCAGLPRCSAFPRLNRSFRVISESSSSLLTLVVMFVF